MVMGRNEGCEYPRILSSKRKQYSKVVRPYLSGASTFPRSDNYLDLCRARIGPKIFQSYLLSFKRESHTYLRPPLSAGSNTSSS